MAYTPLWQDNLPWTETERDKEFSRKAIMYLIISMILLLILTFMPWPEPEKPDLVYVTFVEDKQVLKKKPPPKQEIKKKEQPKKKPPPKKAPPKKKEPPKKKPPPKKAPPKKAPPKKAPPKKAPPKKPKPSQKEIDRKQAEKAASELDSLDDIRDDFDVASLDKNKPNQTGGQNSNQNNTISPIGKDSNKSSGGIGNNYSRDSSGGSLDGRNTTNVTSNLGDGSGSNRQTGGSSGVPERTFDEIEVMFQNKKGTIYNYYQKARRKDPTLRGRIVLEITIQPNGSVSNVVIVSSDLNNPELESKIQRYVKRFKFKKLNVGVLKVKYPLDFLPS